VEWVAQTLLTHPEIAVLLAVGLGATLGRLRYRSISLGAVTGTLIVGVLLGALVRIEHPDGTVASLTVEGPAKNLFFLLFLFALGIRLGPQFVAGLKGSGAPQALSRRSSPWSASPPSSSSRRCSTSTLGWRPGSPAAG
jgi:putative transport protein